MDRGKKIIGIALIAASISALIAWEKWGKTQLLYDEVLVCRENISRGTVMREDMFETVKMDVREEGFLRPEEQKSLIGKEAVSFVHKGMPLFPEYFVREGLSAGKNGRFILSVPEDWLASMPSSIGRGNRAYFYSGKRLLAEAPVSAFDAENRAIEVVVRKEQAAVLSEAAAAGEKMVVVYE